MVIPAAARRWARLGASDEDFLGLGMTLSREIEESLCGNGANARSKTPKKIGLTLADQRT
jgi:hypothetical protein